ncbi:MAG: hypothetical protein WBY94_20285 [Polyangiaceae bacterium]
MGVPLSSPSSVHRRLLLAGVALWVVFGLWSAPQRRAEAQAKPLLYVFLQLDAKSSAVEKALQQHLPDVAVTVFGRFRDFEEVFDSARPDAVLCITPVLEYRGAPVTLQGKRGGEAVEPYVVASEGQPLDGSLAGKTIGIVDLMGRDGTQSFLNRLLKTNDVKMKRVSKIEDLLPLLEFSEANGVVLPSAAAARLAERTRLPIKTRDLPDGMVGLPAVSVVNPDVRATLVKSFQALDGETNHLLGIDSWSTQ